MTLLVASYFFYLNIEPVFGLLTAAITVSTYIFTRLMDKTDDDAQKGRLMYINIAIILLPLFFFKYFTPINNGIFDMLEAYHLRWGLPKISFLLPVGISYYTFMAIGYTVDVYNEEMKAEKNIGIVALFVAFFPLVLSGPIERATNMIPQFNSGLKLDPSNFAPGFKMMLWGYFMKLVVADRVAIYVDAIYNNLANHSGESVLLAATLYPIQVYADLGGYSLIAIGVSRILGIRVMQNFERPFFATSMAVFWRRWHISLIKWLTDYIYTPLAFSFRKYGIWGIVIALMVTFILSGIWHGATWGFLVWGVLQGIFLCVEALLNKRRAKFVGRHQLKTNRAYMIFSIGATFVLFAISEVFIRAISIDNALLVFEKIGFDRGPLFLDLTTLAYSFVGIAMLLLSDFREEYFPKKFRLFHSANIAVRFGSYLFVALLILWVGILNGGQFIYFQF
ncbi:MAG: MBOAT family O-acyltransferase [Pricia sp.]